MSLGIHFVNSQYYGEVFFVKSKDLKHPHFFKCYESRIGSKRENECEYLHVTLANEDHKDIQIYKVVSCKNILNYRYFIVDHDIKSLKTLFNHIRAGFRALCLGLRRGRFQPPYDKFFPECFWTVYFN